MNSALIKVGMPVSYDYKFLYHSLPLIYDHADQITLAVDQNSKTWTGIPFTIEDSFWDWIKKIDVQKKIDVYRDDFSLAQLNAYENQTRERNLIAQRMGLDGWHIQIDSDEYMPDFDGFVRFLRRHSSWVAPSHAPVEIRAFWIPLFRQISDGFLFVKNNYESFSLATNRPNYQIGRLTYYPVIFAPFCVFHQTWARSEHDVWLKINSIGAGKDFNIQSYYNLWKAVDRHNYRFLRNFHPLMPNAWEQLSWCQGKDITEFIHNYTQNRSLAVPTSLLLRRRLGEFKKLLLRPKILQKG